MIEAPLFTPEIGDQIRIAVEHDGAWRPIMWLEVGADGSVYLGPRIKQLAIAKRGSVTPVDGQATIRYSEGEAITAPEEIRGGRVSFHPSGLIIAGGKRLWRTPFRHIRSQHHLCLVLFQHPSSYRPIPTVRKRDVCLRYPLDSERPLGAAVFVAPARGFRLVELNAATYQLNLVFYLTGAREMPDFLVQLVLGHGVTGKWPPLTYVMCWGGKGTR